MFLNSYLMHSLLGINLHNNLEPSILGQKRVIRMVEMPMDPLEPAKFKHKTLSKGFGSPPVLVMRSPQGLLV